jgi:cyclopropane fatty-acyl-phospholipid synthase-like methyltransferase
MLRRAFFAVWYLVKPPWDSGIPAPELVRVIAQRPLGRALDIGCGTGTNVRYLAEHGWQATGLDFVPAAIAQARRKVRGLPATVRVADVTHLAELDLPGPYDLALDMGCFHSLTADGQKRYTLGLKRWLKLGGLYLLYAFQPASGPSDQGLTRAAVVAAFADGFNLVNYEQGQGRPSAWYYFERTP